MALDHTPLADHELSPAALEAMAQPARKMMAARGLSPLPDPRDLVSVLYQLARDGDAAIHEAARKSAAELPDKILGAALADPRLPARVIDYFADKITLSTALVAPAIANPCIADETVAALAAQGSAKVAELCAENETRLLRYPAIVAALYNNPRTAMSIAARAVELCAREGVRVPGIAAWEEVAAAHLKVAVDAPAADADDVFAKAMGSVGESEAEQPAEGTEPTKDTPIGSLPIAMKMRLAALGNASARAILIRDPARPVAMAAIKAPTIGDNEVVRYASNTALSDDVIGYIASRRDWVKLYAVKLALVSNPKTPLTASTRLLVHLRERDLKAVARSKSVPSALTAQAKKLITQRRRGGGRS